jgi:hypothetical protein
VLETCDVLELVEPLQEVVSLACGERAAIELAAAQGSKLRALGELCPERITLLSQVGNDQAELVELSRFVGPWKDGSLSAHDALWTRTSVAAAVASALANLHSRGFALDGWALRDVVMLRSTRRLGETTRVTFRAFFRRQPVRLAAANGEDDPVRQHKARADLASLAAALRLLLADPVRHGLPAGLEDAVLTASAVSGVPEAGLQALQAGFASGYVALIATLADPRQVVETWHALRVLNFLEARLEASEMNCIICTVARPTVVFEQCHHCVVCPGCWKDWRLEKGKGICPDDRADVTSFRIWESDVLAPKVVSDDLLGTSCGPLQQVD